MSQDYNTPSSRKQRRAARGTRGRPVLVTSANTPTSEENMPEQAQSSVATSAPAVEPGIAPAPASVPSPNAPKGRRLPGFFSTLGRGSQGTDESKQEKDIAQARIARATRGKSVTAKTAAVSASAETAKPTASSEKESSAKATPAPARPRSANTGFKTRYIIGMAIYLLVAQFVGYGITSFFAANKMDTILTQFTLFGGQVVIKTSTLIYLAVLIILLVVLARFDFLPRSLSSATRTSRTSGSNDGNDSMKTAQPTMRQGVQGADDDLYREYRLNQRRKK